MSAMTPNKSETAASAFEKLDAAHAGYVTKEQAAKLDGFDKVFTQADKDKDDKLSQEEFRAAWALYTGNPQS
jgi:Ca2+-binding EF-hand superfamily protein